MERIHYSKRVKTDYTEYGVLIAGATNIYDMNPIQYLCHDIAKHGEISEKARKVLENPASFYADNLPAHQLQMKRLKEQKQKIRLSRGSLVFYEGGDCEFVIDGDVYYRGPFDFIKYRNIERRTVLDLIRQLMQYGRVRINTLPNHGGAGELYFHLTKKIKLGPYWVHPVDTDYNETIHTIYSEIQALAYRHFNQVFDYEERAAIVAYLGEDSHVALPGVDNQGLPFLYGSFYFDNDIHIWHDEISIKKNYLIANEIYNRMIDLDGTFVKKDRQLLAIELDGNVAQPDVAVKQMVMTMVDTNPV